MVFWVDAQLSPGLASWLTATFDVKAAAVRDLGLRDAEDKDIFSAARDADAIVLTKDSDFPDLLTRHGAPPRVIWLRCGNTSNAMLRTLLSRMWPDITSALKRGDALIEIRDSAKT